MQNKSNIPSPVREKTKSEITVARLSETITQHVSMSKMAQLLSIKDWSERCGHISKLFSKALDLSNVMYYKEMFYWFEADMYRWVPDGFLELSVEEAMLKCGVTEGDMFKNRNSLIRPSKSYATARTLVPSNEIISFDNGVLNVSTLEFCDPSPALPVITKLGYGYHPEAKCPLWDKFLLEVLPFEQDRLCFQEFAGMIFIDRKKVRMEKICILIGSGSNGKSVAAEVIAGLLGSWNVSRSSLTSLMGEGTNVMGAIAKIDGKLLNISNELDKKELHGAGFKSLVSGDPADAKNLYKNRYTAYDIPLLMASTNELPYTDDKSDGFYRRLMILEFILQITDEMKDPLLINKLCKELSGIFNWALEGRARFEAQDYINTKNERSAEIVKEYQIQQSAELSFVYSAGYMPMPCYFEHQDLEITAATLYDQFKTYCSTYGRKLSSIKTFGMMLKSDGFSKVRERSSVVYTYFKAPSYDELEQLHKEGRTNATQDEWDKIINGHIKPVGGTVKPEFIPKKESKQQSLPLKDYCDRDPDDYPPE